MSAVRGIGFDLDHTLAIDNRLERIAFLRLLELLLARGGTAIGTLADEIAAIDDLLTHQRRGEFSIDDAVRRFVRTHGIEPADDDAQWFRRTSVEMVDALVVPLPGVPETLQGLRDRGIATAVLTNGWNPMQRRKAERVGFSGTILVSSEIGVQKPAPASFQALLESLGTRPHETWYVGDDPRGDIAGAQAVGMHGVWIDWESKEYPKDLAPPLHRISRFNELLGLLPSPVQIS
jgi:HAD superfamily hydrolase (TIGR01509 family)